MEASTHPPGWCGEFLVYNGGPKGAIAVRVQGESMEPEYRDGDMIVVDPSQTVKTGVACVLLNSNNEREAVLKIVQSHGVDVVLKSTNSEYAPRKVPASGIAACYKVIDHLCRAQPKRREK